MDLANEGDVKPFIRFIGKCTEMTLDLLLIATTDHSVDKALPEANPNHSDYTQTILVTN